MNLVCWYCGRHNFKNRKSLYRHWGWCEEYKKFKATGILPLEFESRKQKYITQQTKHPMPSYMKKKPIRVPGY
jgi:hypothetical protein